MLPITPKAMKALLFRFCALVEQIIYFALTVAE
jgi:hypothetical protein